MTTLLQTKFLGIIFIKNIYHIQKNLQTIMLNTIQLSSCVSIKLNRLFFLFGIIIFEPLLNYSALNRAKICKYLIILK